jgi:hypothetical protein
VLVSAAPDLTRRSVATVAACSIMRSMLVHNSRRSKERWSWYQFQLDRMVLAPLLPFSPPSHFSPNVVAFLPARYQTRPPNQICGPCQLNLVVLNGSNFAPHAKRKGVCVTSELRAPIHQGANQGPHRLTRWQTLAREMSSHYCVPFFVFVVVGFDVAGIFAGTCHQQGACKSAHDTRTCPHPSKHARPTETGSLSPSVFRRNICDVITTVRIVILFFPLAGLRDTNVGRPTARVSL